jgi:hypothetical protein
MKDQEISGGTLRNFDVLLEAERDVPLGWFGGGIELTAPFEIRVSYPVSEPDLPRFMGADGQDIAGVLVRLHLTTPGMFPVSMREELPIFDIVANGDQTHYVGSFFGTANFFASDQLARAQGARRRGAGTAPRRGPARSPVVRADHRSEPGRRRIATTQA